MQEKYLFFISPVMTFIFLLPISFGNIGIREGAYIFFYGIIQAKGKSSNNFAVNLIHGKMDISVAFRYM
jgi:hypothetical protein